MSAVDPSSEKELVVADDGSIPADQLASLGLRPGAHLRVVSTDPQGEMTASLAGCLPDLPDLEWADFERGSALAQRDLTAPS